MLHIDRRVLFPMPKATKWIRVRLSLSRWVFKVYLYKTFIRNFASIRWILLSLLFSYNPDKSRPIFWI